MNGIVYRYDATTGIYQGEYQSQESPLEPGKWLDDIPNTLKIAPPATGQNEVACAVDGAWVIKADYRGTTWYKPDGSAVEITELDVLPEQDWSIEPPPETPEQTVARLKAELDAIERAEIMPRKTREIQIQLMEFLAAQQGITPEQLALNPAYAGMKAVDAQCVALRQQIRDLEP